MRIALDQCSTSEPLLVTRTTRVGNRTIDAGLVVQLLVMPRGQVGVRLWSGRGDYLAVFASMSDAERWADEAGLEERQGANAVSVAAVHSPRSFHSCGGYS